MVDDSAHSGSKLTLAKLPNSEIGLSHWSGPITAQDRAQNLERMTEFCQENGLSRLLIDGRDQVNKTGVMDSMAFGASVPDAFRGLNVAVVHRPDDETLSFIEAVAFNRGSGTKAFTDYDEAVAWLEK